MSSVNLPLLTLFGQWKRLSTDVAVISKPIRKTPIDLTWDFQILSSPTDRWRVIGELQRQQLKLIPLKNAEACWYQSFPFMPVFSADMVALDCANRLVHMCIKVVCSASAVPHLTGNSFINETRCALTSVAQLATTTKKKCCQKPASRLGYNMMGPWRLKVFFISQQKKKNNKKHHVPFFFLAQSMPY